MTRRKVIILGAGISGLSLGWFLKKQHGESLDLQIIEKAPHPGGMIRTLQKDGFLFELGPHSIRFTGGGEETLNLIQELGLQQDLIEADPSSSIRYLWMQNNLVQVPNNLTSMLFSSVTKGIIPALFRDLFAPASTKEDESIEQFIKRRFGSRIANQMIDPLVSGIYAGDIKKLSIRASFPSLYEWEKKYGSVLKGVIRSRKNKAKTKAGIFSFKKGLQQLTDTLADRLQKHLKLSTTAKSIEKKNNGVLVRLTKGSELFADRLYTTLSPNSLVPFFREQIPEIADLLAEIPNAPIATVSFGYKTQILKKKGFGYLIPSQENEKILGMIWDSSVFTEQNQQKEETRVTVMMGGARMKDFSKYNESNFEHIAKDALIRHLGIDKEPDCSHVTVYQEAIPQYLVGHTLRLQAIEALMAIHFPAITFHGNGFYGVSINDCIQRSKTYSDLIRI